MRGTLSSLTVPCLALLLLLSSATPALGTCNNLAKLRLAAHRESWVLPYLNIAGLAYTDESNSAIGNISIDLPRLVNSLPPLPCPYMAGTVPGRWVFEWGAARSRDNSNLIYAASYRVFTNTTSVPFNASSPLFPPVFLAFGVRGTDTLTNGTGLVLQLLEDFEPFTTVDWGAIAEASPAGIRCPLSSVNGTPPAGQFSASPRVAWGSCVGLKSLMVLTSRPATLGGGPTTALGFLNSFIARWSSAVRVIVTGHSLGGTQTTAVALYLQSRVSRRSTRIGAFPFAPSTAGNAAFASLFNSTIGARSQLYMNSLDLVPHGYQYVVATLGLWFLYGGPLPPSYLIPLVPLVYEGLKNIGYTHPAPNNWMQGRYNPNSNATYPAPSQWGSQLEWQHSVPEYYEMLCYYFAKVKSGGTARKTMADYPLGGSVCDRVWWEWKS